MNDELSPSGVVVRDAQVLATEPELWSVDLRDGRVITVIAHAYRVDDDDVVFSLLFRGTPNFEVGSLRLPLDLLPDGFS